MSRCCRREAMPTPVFVNRPFNNCICSLPTLVILILIVLQFSKCNDTCKKDNDECDYDDHDDHGDDYDDDDEHDECDEEEDKCCKHDNQQVGNGILFIIALFFLSCAGCGTGYSGGYGY